MSDRELLELAAKAAGVKGGFIERRPEDGYHAYSCGIGNAGQVSPLWNPLTCDGDALPLAVQLRLRIDTNYRPSAISPHGVGVWTPGDYSPCPPFWQYNSDMNMAVRHTIVRAAAEIGKAMPTAPEERN